MVEVHLHAPPGSQRFSNSGRHRNLKDIHILFQFFFQAPLTFVQGAISPRDDPH